MQIDIRPPSTAQLSNFKAVSNPLRVTLSWDTPTTDPDYRATQVFVSTVNDFESATLYNTVASNQIDYPTTDTAIRYFWVRSVNQYGRADGAITGPVTATAAKINTENIGVFDLATANIVNKLAVGNISGLGALALLNEMNAENVSGLGYLATRDTITASRVTNLGALAVVDQLAANQIGAGQLAVGVVYAGEIDASQVTAGTLTGRTVQTSSGATRVVMDGTANVLRVYTSGSQNVLLGTGGGGTLDIKSVSSTVPAIHAQGSSSSGSAMIINGSVNQSGGTAYFRNTNPFTPRGFSLGSSSYEWTDLYLVNAATVTSDVRTKTDIEDVDLGLSFINTLRPVSYRLKVGKIEEVVDEDAVGPYLPGQPPLKKVEYPGVRRHMGLLAQDVKDAIGDRDLALWTLADKGDPNSQQALRNEELIPVLIKAIQELSADLTTVKAQLLVDKGQ